MINNILFCNQLRTMVEHIRTESIILSRTVILFNETFLAIFENCELAIKENDFYNCLNYTSIAANHLSTIKASLK